MVESFCKIDTVFQCNTVNPPLFSAVKNQIWWVCTKDDKDGCNLDNSDEQGGRTWQAFGGGKNGHETFRQARNYNFRDKCVVFARYLKFSNLTQ